MAAFQDEPTRRDDTVGALLARQLRTLLDAVERIFGGSPEDGEGGSLAPHLERVVAPLSGRDLARVDRENGVEL